MNKSLKLTVNKNIEENSLIKAYEKIQKILPSILYEIDDKYKKNNIETKSQIKEKALFLCGILLIIYHDTFLNNDFAYKYFIDIFKTEYKNMLI